MQESHEGEAMKSIDIKSLIIGLLLCAVVFMLMGHGGNKGSNEHGHYQVACGISDTSRCVVIDTTNGEVQRDFKCQGLLGCELKG